MSAGKIRFTGVTAEIAKDPAKLVAGTASFAGDTT